MFGLIMDLAGSSCMDLPIELKSPKKRKKSPLKITIKDPFYGCHVRHINLLNEHPESI